MPHSGELPYVFGWSLLELAPEVQLDSRVTVPWLDWNELDFDYAEYTMDLFTNFAKYLWVYFMFDNNFVYSEL